MSLGGTLIGTNFNSTADQAITITSPTPNYRVNIIQVNKPSTSLTTAAGGFYTSTAKGGVALIAASQTYSALTTPNVNTAGSSLQLAGGNTTTTYLSISTHLFVYLSLTTPQGAAATVDIYVLIIPLP